MSRTFLLFAALCSVFAANAMALEVGQLAPDFSARSYDGKDIKLSDYRGKIVVMEWFNPGCPFVKKHYQDGHMPKLQENYTAKGVIWLSVNSTNPAHENFIPADKAQDMLDKLQMKATAAIFDPEGKLGKLYGAKTTPHMFVVNAQGNLVYQGAIDDSPEIFGSPEKARNYVAETLEELLAAKPVTGAETKSYGCSVKYAN